MSLGDAVSLPLALVVTAVGSVCILAALVWLFGPWGLLGCGAVLVALGLLVDVRERRGEPAEHSAPPV